MVGFGVGGSRGVGPGVVSGPSWDPSLQDYWFRHGHGHDLRMRLQEFPTLFVLYPGAWQDLTIN